MFEIHSFLHQRLSLTKFSCKSSRTVSTAPIHTPHFIGDPLTLTADTFLGFKFKTAASEIKIDKCYKISFEKIKRPITQYHPCTSQDKKNQKSRLVLTVQAFYEEKGLRSLSGVVGYAESKNQCWQVEKWLFIDLICIFSRWPPKTMELVLYL